MVRSRTTRMALCLTIIALGSGYLPAQALAQSVVEAKLVLKDIRHWLPGTYDNESQIFVETAFGTGAEGNHAWWQIEIEAIENTGLGDDVFIARHINRERSDQSVERVQLLAFSLDEPMRAVRMTTYDLPNDMGTDGNGQETASAAAIVHPGCPIYWRQGPGHIYGAMRGSWCTANSTDRTLLLRSELRLTEGEYWVFAASKDAKTGNAINGRKDEVPLRFNKVRWYECFVFIFDRKGGPGEMTLIDPFTLHDGGGRYFFETDEPNPRQFEVFLRRGLWPSASGNNLVHTVQLFLYADGNRDKELTNGHEVITAWSPADSGKVGWRTAGLGGSQCKPPAPSPFE
jgi:hypothetical protein